MSELENITAHKVQEKPHIEPHIEPETYGSEPSDSDADVDGDVEVYNVVEAEAEADADGAFGITYHKLSYHDVQCQINKAYAQDIVHRYSSALDILASYVRGQKTIYMETRSYISVLLNCLMFPSIFLSALVTVLQEPFGQNYPVVLASVSGAVTFLLALSNYANLDGAVEAHKISSYQYDKLQSYIEFQSGQVLLFSDPILNSENMERYCEKERQILNMEAENIDVSQNSEKKIWLANAEREMLNQIHQVRLDAENELINTMRESMIRIETQIKDIKELNQYVIPQKIRYTYPVLYNTNVFSVIKKIDDYRAKTLTDLKHVKNELRYIQAYLKKNAGAAAAAGATADAEVIKKYKKRSNDLFKEKKRIVNIILFLNTAFAMIDKMFQQEILNDKLRKEYWLRFYLYDTLSCLCVCSPWLKRLLPTNYIEPEAAGGDIFEKILGFGIMV